MAQRTCDVDGCERHHSARGMCSSHYGTWHRSEFGRNDRIYAHVCEFCGDAWTSRGKRTRFCSDACKGQHYSRTMRRKSMLPADHPVIAMIHANKMAARAAARKPARPAYEWRTARECPGCACWFTPLHTPNAVTCSRSCARRCAKRRRRAREHGARGSWTWPEFMRIAKRFNYCCAYCGEKPDRLDPDHVVPLSRGGYDSPTNLLPTCAMCNSSKCAMTLSEWSDWLDVRDLPARATSWSIDDRRYWHLTQAMLPIAA